MIPLRLTLSGFMSYCDEQTLDFQDDSLWVIVGKNASGKSSVFDAIIFALFGETRVAGINNNELINHNSDIAEIVFDFASNSTKYRVKRTIPKKGSATRQASLLLSKPDGSLSPQPIPGTHTESGFKKWVENDLGLNYEVFITSILLRQGKADAFLEAGTGTRYEVLAKLIDLSNYVALAEKAREQKNHWRDQATFHRDNLSRLSPVTEQDLADAQTCIDLEYGVVESARQQAEHIQTLYGQASRWEQLNSDLHSTDNKIAVAETLLTRSNEIEDNYHRLVELRTVIPGLKATFDLLQAIDRAETEIRKLSDEEHADGELIKAEEIAVENLKAERDQKAQQFQNINDESVRIFRRLNDLSSVMSIIAQIKQLEQTLEKHQTALAKFPEDLDARLHTSENRRDQLAEIERNLPGLKRFASDRSRLSDTARRRLSLADQLTKKQNTRPYAVEAQATAQANHSEAEAHEKEMRYAQTKANTLLEEARRHLSNFKLIVNAAKCQYCGKELSQEHKVEEQSRLLKDITEKEQLEITAQENLGNAIKSLVQAKELRQSTTSELSEIDRSITSISQEISGLDHQIQGQLSDLSISYDSLPVVHQEQVSLEKPTNPDEWVNTVYPQSHDLFELDNAVKQLPQSRAEAANFAKQVRERDQAHTRWSETNRSLENSSALLPSDWATLQLENDQLSNVKESIEADLEVARRTRGLANDAYEKARRGLEAIRNRQSRRGGTLTTLQSTSESNLDYLETQIAQLPEGWRAEARSMTESRLSNISKEKQNLEQFEEQHQQLAMAEQGLGELRSHKLDVQVQIGELPLEARQPAEQVNRKLSEALDDRSQAEGRLTAAENMMVQMAAQKTQYQETESSMKAAERKSFLYGILSEQFGERGIQKAIINKAEVAIVHLSNQVLDSLSGGRSKLRLREAGGNKKALDLEVWDSQTGGDKPILTGLASGSQRFRIAISLALGIGQYIGRESNRIESVIIDEGFGSLDREGRESIIQEIYNLRQHLKRIILVSHQEEFSRGFSTGYEIFLENGSSQVKPLAR